MVWAPWQQDSSLFEGIPNEHQPSSLVIQAEKKRPAWLSTIFLTTLALLTGCGVTYFMLSKQPNVSATADLSESTPVLPKIVTALGFLEPAGEVVQLSAPAFMEGSRIQTLLVQRGDQIQPGQVIAILDSRDRLQAALQEAEAQVRIAQAQLQQVQAGAKKGEINAQRARFQRARAELEGQIASQQATIERIMAELKNATTECNRYSVLLRDGAVSASRRDSVCIQQEIAQEQLNEGRATLERTMSTVDRQIQEAEATLNAVAEVRTVDVQLAIAELEHAKARVQRAQANLDVAYVKSPSEGQVLEVNAWEGEIVGPDGIVALGNTSQMYVSAEVYETDINRVRVGQQVQLTSDGVVGNLQGIVEDIGLQIATKDVLGTDPVADADARVVEVKIRLTPDDSTAVAGLTNLQMNVLIDTSDSTYVSQTR